MIIQSAIPDGSHKDITDMAGGKKYLLVVRLAYYVIPPDLAYIELATSGPFRIGRDRCQPYGKYLHKALQI